jgi:hypothetical protein
MKILCGPPAPDYPWQIRWLRDESIRLARLDDTRLDERSAGLSFG